MAFASKTRLYLSIAAGVVAVSLVGTGGWLWMERAPIAASYIDAALRANGVPARYRLARIGIRTHRIEAIRIGDPEKPDLVADWAEIELDFGLSGVRVRAVDAGGIRLRGRLVDGKLSLGAIDRLLPKTASKEPFALPDIELTARAIQLLLDTPAGLIVARLDGKGGLADGFRGSFAARSNRLAAADCGIASARATLSIQMDAGKPRLSGPIQARGLRCANASLADPRLTVSAQGSADLTSWRGTAAIGSGRLTASGSSAERGVGAFRFAASTKSIDVQGHAALRGVRYGDLSLASMRVNGRYGMSIADRRGRLKGVAHIDDARASRTLIANIARYGNAADGTPLGPVLAAWTKAIGKAAADVDGSAAFELSHAPEGGALRVDRLDLRAASGALLSGSAESGGLGWRWPRGGALLNGRAELGGGGLPAVRTSVRQDGPGGAVSGDVRIAPYRVGRARLRVAPVAVRGQGGRVRIATAVEMDGPLADGRIEGLSLPINAELTGNAALRVNAGCTVLSFERVALAGATVSRTRLPLCPVGGAMLRRGSDGSIGGGAVLARPRLRGRLAGDPLLVEAKALLVELGRPGFRLDGLAVRLGAGDSQTRLDVRDLGGAVDPRGISGRFSNLAGKIGAVPLLLEDAAGDWRLASSVLILDGSARIEDSDRRAPRFNPLAARDMRLRLADGKIGMNGRLHEPRSGQPVAAVTIAHDLSSGRGDARITVDRLRFGKSLQPEAITPLTLGVIANVEGGLSGEGHIRWAGGAVSSDGRFTTDGLNLAAAFGPVTGLKGTINFVDLLGMVTAPDQVVTIDEVNPGVSVTNGVIRYRILPEQKLDVAEGLWPFAGGTLRLEPTLLDMGQPVARKLTFRIEGLDAATFVQQLEFKNIAVTGKFDGTLPIIFDAQGGRIENGFLRVRPGGGTLSYVGDVTNADLGRMARIAFDALKSMRYDRLTIDLNGSLDGEIVSQVRFDGTNSDPVETARRGGIVGRLLSPLTRLPFRFKITITAPFRGLVNSAQSFVDPSILLRGRAEGAAPDPSSIQPR